MSRNSVVGVCALLVTGWCFGNLLIQPEVPSTAPETSRLPTSAAWNDVPVLIAAESENTWGDLQGQFLYSGKIPEQELLTLNKDIEVCSKVPPRSESLVVDDKSRGIANVVVWLDLKRKQTVPVHESYARTANSKVVFDNDHCRFEPHVCLLRTTQTLVVGNNDPVAHSAAFFMTRNDPFSALVQGDKAIEKQFPLTENIPSPVSCPIHAWMKGWLLVKDHPYMAVTDREGRFSIPNLPAGDWTFRVWHEMPGYVTDVKVDDRAATWEQGRVSVSIQPGKNSLGTVTLDASLFE